MRFTEQELAFFGGDGTADLEGRLSYRPPKGGNFSQSGFKDRWFRLKYNFLFYYRFNEIGAIDRREPAGVFVLEHSQVHPESTLGASFAFSIFFGEEAERKHIFCARSEDQMLQWVTAIKASTYENLRSQLRAMQSKIKHLTGKDPLLMYPHNESKASSNESPAPSSPSRPERVNLNRGKVNSFKSHVNPTSNNNINPSSSEPDPRPKTMLVQSTLQNDLRQQISGENANKETQAPLRPMRGTPRQQPNPQNQQLKALVPSRPAPPLPQKDLIEF